MSNLEALAHELFENLAITYCSADVVPEDRPVFEGDEQSCRKRQRVGHDVSA